VADGLGVVVHNIGHLHLPELIPLDIYLWGLMKVFVCQLILGTRYSLFHNIFLCWNSPAKKFQQTDAEYTLDLQSSIVCFETEGGYLQHFL